MFGAADGGHDARGPVDRDAVQQRRRERVEQVGIVDADDDVAIGEQGAPGGGDLTGGIVRNAVADPLRERAQRNGA